MSDDGYAIELAAPAYRFGVIAQKHWVAWRPGASATFRATAGTFAEAVEAVEHNRRSRRLVDA